MSALLGLTLPVALTPEAIEALREASRLHPSDIDLLADAIVQKLNATPAAMSVKQFAQRVGKSPSFIHAEIRAGRLRAIRPGSGDRMVLPKDPSEWLGGRS